MNDENIDFYKIEKEWKKRVRKLHDNFVEEFTMENPGFVKERRLEFLKNELSKQIKDNLWKLEILLSIRNTVWLKEAVREVWLIPGMKKTKRIQREIDFYENPGSYCVDGNSNSKINDEMIERAKNANCSEFIEIKRKVGNKSWALCPFHKEKTPSFCCYEGGKGFFCYGCNKGGDAITLVRELYNLSFVEAVTFINKS